MHLRRHGVSVFGTRQELVAALGTYADRRLSGPLGERLEPSSWELQVTALSRFYDWAQEEGLAKAVPFTVAVGKRMVQGRFVETWRNRARTRRPKPHVKLQYLAPDFADLFRHGLAGLGPDGLDDATFRGRFPGRNAAMGGVVLGTGMRSREFTYLLVHEVPPLPAEPTEVPIPWAVRELGAKGRKFRWTWIDRRRLRTTFIAQRGQRQWSPRATIDPNHSPQVEGDHYLSAATPAQKAVVEEIARDAQGDLLRRASAPVVVDEAVSAARLPEKVRRLGLAEGALAARRWSRRPSRSEPSTCGVVTRPRSPGRTTASWSRGPCRWRTSGPPP
jgi:hypothetical protein